MITKINQSASEKILLVFILILGIGSLFAFLIIKNKCLFVKNYNPYELSFDKPENIAVLKPENRSIDFGLGLNMAKSLKDWVFATDILETGTKNTVKYTHAGNIIFGPKGKDKYLENINTIWFLHYKLVRNLSNCTTWAWFFNYFTESRFDKNRLLNDLLTFADRSQGNFSEESLKRDIDCFLRSYTVKQISSEKLIEDGLESPFLELELIQSESSNIFFINRDFRQTLSAEILH